jgi:mannose-6-phosphate isomerase
MTTSTDSHGREFDVRPWGHFTVLDDEMFDHKVKRIVVNPNSRLSYQRHAQRAEHWFVVSGRATVILEGVEHELGPGDSISIGLGQAHRCENRGDVPVVFIEVQHGSYFGEDDIVRLEDDFGRAD